MNFEDMTDESMKYCIGLDLSLKSTGVCVRDLSNGKCSYTIIAAKLTKAQQAFKHKDLEFVCYFRDKTSKDDSFALKEQKKTLSVWNVTERIRSIIKKYKKKKIRSSSKNLKRRKI